MKVKVDHGFEFLELQFRVDKTNMTSIYGLD